jgi:hypothetical protein
VWASRKYQIIFLDYFMITFKFKDKFYNKF